MISEVFITLEGEKQNAFPYLITRYTNQYVRFCVFLYQLKVKVLKDTTGTEPVMCTIRHLWRQRTKTTPHTTFIYHSLQRDQCVRYYFAKLTFHALWWYLSEFTYWLIVTSLNAASLAILVLGASWPQTCSLCHILRGYRQWWQSSIS